MGSAKDNLRGKAPARPVLEVERTADCQGQLLGYGQAKTGSSRIPVPGLLPPIEGLKNSFALPIGNPRAAIEDNEVDLSIRLPPALDFRLSSKLQGIVDEIRQDPPESMGPCGHDGINRL